MGKFADGVKAYAIKAESKMARTHRAVILEAFSRVIQRTPVDTGRARGNWQVSYGTNPTWTPGNPLLPKNASEQERIFAMLDAVKPGVTTWLSNGLPYIMVLEYGGYQNPPKGGEGKTSGGYSIQAPSGMVRITALDFGSIVKDVDRG